MAFDTSTADNLNKFLDDFIKVLSDNDKYLNSSQINEIKRAKFDFNKNLKDAMDGNRNLKIGIIGDVKAGKSSFLNAMFFDGKDVLPKACTPMTAALTKITYSDKPGAVIHFYTKEDWQNIIDRANAYDKAFEDAYNQKCEEFNNKEKGKIGKVVGKVAEAFTGEPSEKAPVVSVVDKEKFRKQFNKEPEIESLLGCKELIEMAKRQPGITNKLGQTEEVSGTTSDELNDFVGASGTYTPIVNYVELKINNPDIKEDENGCGIEIIDTPGLNDPIVSRGNITMDFLAECDVVFLLSPCTSFMPENSIALMTKQMPATGVKDIIVVGSKLDSGILDDNVSKSFKVALRTSMDRYNRSLNNTITALRQNSTETFDFDQFIKNQPLYVSSMIYAIANKKSDNIPLNKEETLVLNNLKRWDDFKAISEDADQLMNYSGIFDVQDKLQEIEDRKEEIIKSKNESFAVICIDRIQHDINNIISECENKKIQLSKYDVEELKERYGKLKSTINLARSQLDAAFMTAANETQKTLSRICSRIRNEQSAFTSPLKVTKKTKIEHHEYRHGLFGCIKDEKEVEVKYYTAETSEAMARINSYIARCTSAVNDDFDNLFNFAKLSQKVTKIILEPFSEKDDFNENDIRSNLEKLRSDLEIPPREAIEFSSTKYLNELKAQNNGVAKNGIFKFLGSDRTSLDGTVNGEQIGLLNNNLMKVLTEIQDDYIKLITEYADNVTSKIKEQSVNFSTNIENSFSEDFEKLSAQTADKETSLKALDDLINTLKLTLSELDKLKGN